MANLQNAFTRSFMPRFTFALRHGVLSLCVGLALGKAQPATRSDSPAGGSKQFRAGAATSNITPPLGISLTGIIAQNGTATHIHDELHARCLVLDDGSTRIAIVVCDSTMISREIFDRAKQWVADSTGLATSRMLISSTHSHSTPRPLGLVGTGNAGDSALPIDSRAGRLEADYEDFLARRIGDGIRRAINNLAPARIGWGSGRKPEWLFNRRWFLIPGAKVANPFGEETDRVQMNPPAGSPKISGPAGGVDPELFILSVQHADGRPLAVLANYGLHYIGGTGAGIISADYFGAFADRLTGLLAADREDPPFVAMMSNGTSGDVNGRDVARPEPAGPPYAKIAQVADSIAREAHRVYQEIKHNDWVPLAMEERELELAVRRPGAERVEWARAVLAKAKSAGPPSRPEVYAREALALAAFPPTVRLKLQAVRIGDLGIAAASCEIFAATGLQMKERSPFARTFTITLANGYNGYLPTPHDHALGGYETWPARSSYLEVQASEKIRDALLQLLQSVRRVD
jgi:neutral ceramidase